MLRGWRPCTGGVLLPATLILMDGPNAATAQPVIATSDPEILAVVRKMLAARIGRGWTPRKVAEKHGTPRVQPEGP